MCNRRDELNGNSKLRELQHKMNWMQFNDDTVRYTNEGISYNTQEGQWYVLYKKVATHFNDADSMLTMPFTSWEKKFYKIREMTVWCSNDTIKKIQEMDGVYSPKGWDY